MKTELAVDVDHVWKRLINLANMAKADPRAAAAAIVRSLAVHRNQEHIDQLRELITNELMKQNGKRVPLDRFQIHTVWVEVLKAARQALV